MNIQVNRVFLKELSKLPTKERLKVEKLLFEDVEHYTSPAQIPNFQKLKGFKNYYKIRFGDYSAGFRMANFGFFRGLQRGIKGVNNRKHPPQRINLKAFDGIVTVSCSILKARNWHF